MTLDFKNLTVKNVQTGGGAGSELTESITLHFDSVRVTYLKQKEDGSKDGAPVVADLTTSSRCK
jgi:type VI protein secretion system component Hcp